MAFARDVSAVDAVDVFTTDAHGRRTRDLTTGYAMFNTDPAWSPDGRQIALVVSDHGGALAVMNADGTDKKSLETTTTGGELESPSWSTDGRWIVYSADVGLASPNRGIYAVHPDGSEKHQLRVGGFDPQWAPNGRRIAYALGSNPERPIGIAVMNADGSGSQVIVRRTGATHPRWSPDGQRIAYTLASPKRSNVYVVSALGGVPRLAIINRHGAFDPTWRPPTPLTPPGRPCS